MREGRTLSPLSGNDNPNGQSGIMEIDWHREKFNGEITDYRSPDMQDAIWMAEQKHFNKTHVGKKIN